MRIILKILIILLPAMVSAQQISSMKEQVLAEVVGLEEQIDKVSQLLWDYSEIALEEHKSADLLIEILEKEGFNIEKSVAGMPTAFVATYGTGDPVIA